MKTTLCLLVLIAACTAEVPPEPVPDQRAVNVAIAAWEEAGRAYTMLCYVTRPQLVIHAADDVLEYCTMEAPLDTVVHGCFVPPVTDASPVIITTTDPGWRADTVATETLHWLKWCVTGDPDVNHLDHELWTTIRWSAIASLPAPELP